MTASIHDADSSRGRWRDPRTAWLVLPPLGAFVLGNLLYFVAAHRAGLNYLTPASHLRFDAAHYEDVARRGYHVVGCLDLPPSTHTYEAGEWCGNVGWFPLFPWLTRAVHAVTPLEWSAAALVTAELATLAMFALLWWTILRVVPAPVVSAQGRRAGLVIGSRQLALLALGLLAPAGIYFYAGFPMSLAVAASVAYLGLLARRRWVWAGIAGAAAAMSYPVAGAVVASGLLALTVLAWRQEIPRGRSLAGAALAIAGLPIAGLLAVFADMRLETGHWDAYFTIQDHYRGIGHNPLLNFINLIASPRRGGGDHRIELLRFVTVTEMWLSIGLIVLVLLAAHIGALQGRLAALDVGLTTLVPVMFLVPLVAGVQISQFRSHLLMLPAIIVLRHLPVWLLWLIAPGLACIAYWMGTLYFASILG